MAAVPIYVWNGTAWQETGPTIPASPIKYQASAPSSPSTGDIWVDSDGDVTSGSTQLQRFRFVASGGETSLSGNDANGATLAYTAGMEQVVLNGAVLVRGHDYTATDGTSISGLSPALVANDVVEVFSFMAFNVANTYTQSQVDGLLDSYVGLRLITPTSVANGTIGATGAVTFTGVSSVSFNEVFSSTYDNYKIILSNCSMSTAAGAIRMRLRVGGSDNSTASSYVRRGYNSSSGSLINTIQSESFFGLVVTPSLTANQVSHSIVELFTPFTAVQTGFTYNSFSRNDETFTGGGGYHNQTVSYDGFTIYTSNSNNFAGTIRVYGYKN